MEIIIIYALFFVAMYFILIVPQKKKSKQLSQIRKNIKEGDKVVTIGGMVGVVTLVSDDEFEMEVADGSVIRLKKWGLSAVEREEYETGKNIEQGNS